jgi:thioredoxin-dependent peroxiredoxin
VTKPARRVALSFLLFCLFLPACKKGEPAPGGPSAEGKTGERQRGLLAIGTPAPEFSARAHNGQEVSLAALRGQVVVLYFYPKDGTPGCTVEAEQFSLAHEDLKAGGAVVIGVSSDSNESHTEFAKAHGLPFLLLPDEDHRLARAFGVGTTFGMTQRVTFVIDRAGVIARVYDDVTPKRHAQEILADLEQLGGKSSATRAQ